MKRFRINSEKDHDAIKSASDIVRSGGVIAYPTDTIYGLGCDPFSPQAVEKIYEIKGRSSSSPLIVLLDSADRLKNWCDSISDRIQPLLQLWPAPLSIILKVKADVPEFLTRGGDSLAFRVPDSSICRTIVAGCGGSLTSTSVNRSNEDPLLHPEDIAREFADELDGLVISPVKQNISSTIIKATGSDIEIIREGSFPVKKITELYK